MDWRLGLRLRLRNKGEGGVNEMKRTGEKIDRDDLHLQYCFEYCYRDTTDEAYL